MQFYARHPGTTAIVGPFTVERIKMEIDKGTLSQDDEIVEANGQSLGTLKRSPDWKRIGDILSSQLAALRLTAPVPQNATISTPPPLASDAKELSEAQEPDGGKEVAWISSAVAGIVGGILVPANPKSFDPLPIGFITAIVVLYLRPRGGLMVVGIYAATFLIVCLMKSGFR